MATDDINALATRVEELAALCRRLSAENSELRSRLDGGRSALPADADDVVDPAVVSRRGVLGKALGAAAAGVVGASLLDPGSPAAASNGDPVAAGQTTLTESLTHLKYDGAGGFTGSVFLANDSTYSGASAGFPAALSGWAGAGATAGAGGLANGVFGYTDNGSGYAVVGRQSAANAQTGGAAVYGLSAATQADATAIRGEISSTTPGANSSAVRGQNRGTGGQGVGVHGSHDGSGRGVFGAAPNGGVGVYGSGGARGVEGFNTGSGPGVVGGSASGRGAIFSGPLAAVQLKAGTNATHPAAGVRGDLYVDNTGRLWFCKRGGASPIWKQLA